MSKTLNWAYPVWVEHEFAKLEVEMGDEGLYVDLPLLKKNRQLLCEIRDMCDWLLDKWSLPWLDIRESTIKPENWDDWYTFCKEQGYWSVPKEDEFELFYNSGPCKRNFLKAPFKVNGELSSNAEKWLVKSWEGNTCIEEGNIYYTADSIWGPFSRVDFIDRSPTSDPQKKDWLFKLKWVPTQWNYHKKDKHRRTSPKITLDSFSSLPDKKLGKLLKLRGQAADRIGVFNRIENHIREDGTVRVGGDTLGTATGRMAHKVIVNLAGGSSFYARQTRACLAVKPGRKMVAADASSCQLRLLCHYMGDPEYAKYVMTGRVHERNTEILGCSKRQAKAFIFGLLFGAGDDKLSRDTGLDGSKLRASFMEGLPKLKTLVENLNTTYRERGYLRGIDGRMIQVDSTHKLLCYLLQGAEAVLMKTAAILVDKEIKGNELNADLIWHYHDEYSYSVEEGQTETVKALLEVSITEAGNMIGLKIPHVGEGAIGDNMWETH